jgi:hypothetical protein
VNGVVSFSPGINCVQGELLLAYDTPNADEHLAFNPGPRTAFEECESMPSGHGREQWA